MVRAVIIDDERHARDLLCRQIADLDQGIEVVATADSLKTGYIAIRENNPNVVFMDVELGDGKAFELLGKIENITFKTILITAYPNYAIKAFRFNVTDYLLKPVRIDDLREACLKVTKNGKSVKHCKNIRNTADNIMHSTLIIPHLKGFEILKMNEIIYCRADGYCTNFYLTGGRKIASSKNLKHYEDILDEKDFIRVHHSYIINMNFVKSFSKQGEIKLEEENIAMLGDVYREKFMKYISQR